MIYASEDAITKDASRAKIHGIISVNEIYRENDVMYNFIFFGENGEDIYVYNISDKKYQALDRVTLDVVDGYEEFDEMVMNVLSEHM